MLTQEQINNLKEGDPLIIHAGFTHVDYDGDIFVNCDGSSLWFSPSCVSLPSEHKTVINARDIFHNMSEGEKAMVSNFLSSYFRETKKQEEMCNALKKMGIDLTNVRPKHDPTRLFKKGDIVERRTVYGRTDIDVRDDVVLTVTSDEDAHGNVRVQEPSGRLIVTKSVFLELVTPIEKLEPYSVSEATVQYLVKEDNKKVVAQFCKLYHPHAKAAAEAECARLNAEWRKEQK